ncbi:phosphoglycerate kinase-like [Scaptodrosophila lebanonensis]|uniref:Phosphoglycerate kinase n=1 Tax=Drosophila lebanonensis TaxID=7225 RepID=A0A6J2U5Q5_DROLE|nr:phosphoglycerate kinase-like [Scaptodrosophila lebanonensis]
MNGDKITNNQRIIAALPTIKYMLEQNCKSLVLASHLGRPNGKRNPKFSLLPVAKELERYLGKRVHFMYECPGKDGLEVKQDLPDGTVILLENLRFYEEEEGSTKNYHQEIIVDPAKVKEFRKKLAAMGEIYVNDAFGTAHRRHSSMMGEGYNMRAAGFLLYNELQYFARVLNNPERPLLAILGGGNVIEKIPLIKNLLNHVNAMILSGGMAFTFLKTLKCMEIGKSLYDEKGSKMIPEIMSQAMKNNVEIILPVDFICANEIAINPKEIKSIDIKQGVPKDFVGLDIGEKSVALFRKAINPAKTIVWNGPPGLFEYAAFANGTKAILKSLIEATTSGATTVLSGGDTATACKNAPIGGEGVNRRCGSF